MVHTLRNTVLEGEMALTDCPFYGVILLDSVSCQKCGFSVTSSFTANEFLTRKGVVPQKSTHYPQKGVIEQTRYSLHPHSSLHKTTKFTSP